MGPRTVIFGLDGATFTVLDDLVHRGIMPFLGEFMSRGACGTLTSTIPPLTPPAWTTLVTGRSPGAHGIFNFLQFESEDSPYLRIPNSRWVCCETIWSIVSRAGRRATSLNFVKHSPAPRINGFIVPGWVPWRWVKKHSHPAGLVERLEREIPDLDIMQLAMNFKEEKKAVAGSQMQDYGPWIDLHIQRERHWFSVMKHLLIHEPCELTGIVFDGVDKLQHLLWKYLDPALEPADPTPEFIRTRERCWDYYRIVDGFLKKVIEIAGDDALVLIASDHGFCGSTEILYINTWLEQQGWLTWLESATPESLDSQELGEAHPYHLTHIDLSRTRAYATSAGSNGIHINVVGDRGMHGIDPSECESFRAELCDALLTRCNDPETGEPLIRKVWTRDEIFTGPRIGFAPDLTVELRDFGFFSVMRSDRVYKRRPTVMGCHHPHGVLIAGGAGVRPGVRLAPRSLLDIAPTVLYALGVPVPEDMEGSIIAEMFTDQYRNANPVCMGPPTIRTGSNGAAPVEGFDAKAEAQVMMRLKALGYVE